MSGENESQQLSKAEQRLIELDEQLDLWERSLGLPDLPKEADAEAKKLLTMSSAELRSLSPDQARHAAVVLRQLSFHLARAASKQKARIRWAEKTLMAIVAPRLGTQRQYASAEERFQLAVNACDISLRIQRLLLESQMRLDRIEGLAGHVGFYANSFGELAQSSH